MLRKIPIYRSLTRQNLILGGERHLVLILGVVAAILAFVSQSLQSIFLGAILWVSGIWILRKMGKNDPQLSKVYLRHLKQQDYYGPFSRPSRNERGL